MEGPTVARGEQLWQPYMVRGTIGGVVFGPAGSLAVQTTYGVTATRKQKKRKRFSVVQGLFTINS